MLPENNFLAKMFPKKNTKNIKKIYWKGEKAV